MKPELLLTKAINTLNRWNEEVTEDAADQTLLTSAQMAILEYSLANLQHRNTAPVRHGIALAYAILDLEEIN